MRFAAVLNVVLALAALWPAGAYGQRFPSEAPPRVVRTPLAAQAQPRAADVPTDSGRLIDLLVVWTPAAEAAAGGAAAMQALVDAAERNANAVYRNSGVAQRVRLVHAQQVAYAERSGPCTDPVDGGQSSEPILCALFDLTGAADGFVDGVHALRDAHGADLVALLVRDTAYCGVAWLPLPPSPATSHLGFAVVDQGCAIGNLSFSHELAHNMGAHHDPFVLGLGSCSDGREPGAWCFSRGVVNVAGRWRTVMSYNTECLAAGVSCARLPYLSNPALTFGGALLGDVALGNNALTLNRTAKSVAAYRPTSPLHPLPQRFADVPPGSPYFGHVEFLAQAEISAGCAAGAFCPDAAATREQAAVFLERAKRASNWAPPPAVGLFADVAATRPFAPHIEALYADGITDGCDGARYCPDAPLTRAQAAAMLLRARCGASYVPATPAAQTFADVPPAHVFYAHIGKLHELGVTAGCATGPLRFCPDDAATRAQLAAMIERGYPFPAPTETCPP
jgi:hypothetical protein